MRCVIFRKQVPSEVRPSHLPSPPPRPLSGPTPSELYQRRTASRSRPGHLSSLFRRRLRPVELLVSLCLPSLRLPLRSTVEEGVGRWVEDSKKLTSSLSAPASSSSSSSSSSAPSTSASSSRSGSSSSPTSSGWSVFRFLGLGSVCQRCQDIWSRGLSKEGRRVTPSNGDDSGVVWDARARGRGG